MGLWKLPLDVSFKLFLGVCLWCSFVTCFNSIEQTQHGNFAKFNSVSSLSKRDFLQKEEVNRESAEKNKLRGSYEELYRTKRGSLEAPRYPLISNFHQNKNNAFAVSRRRVNDVFSTSPTSKRQRYDIATSPQQQQQQNFQNNEIPPQINTRTNIINAAKVIQRSTHIITPQQQKRKTIIQPVIKPSYKPQVNEHQNIQDNSKIITNNIIHDYSSSSKGKEFLRSFMRPTAKNEEEKIAAYITNRMKQPNTFYEETNNTLSNETQAYEDTPAFLTNESSTTDFFGDIRSKIITPSNHQNMNSKLSSEQQVFPNTRPSIVSFFKEEGNRGDDDNDDTAFFENSFMNGLTSLEDNVPIISKLIKGTLDQDIEKENSLENAVENGNKTTSDNPINKSINQTNTTNNFEHQSRQIDLQAPDYDIMLDNYYNTGNNTMHNTINESTALPSAYSESTALPSAHSESTALPSAHSVPMVAQQNIISNQNAQNHTVGYIGTSQLIDNANQLTGFYKTNSQIIQNQTPHHTDNIDVSDLIKAYDNIENNENDINNKTLLPVQHKINKHRIQFHLIQTSKPHGVCMDGSKPGYYLRKGFETGENKWIIHLHGGAWCYDLQSCLKRRKTILGSTEKSNKADIRSFFHGLLSKSAKVNPEFYNWNVAVLSYCDGGLFSGTRRSSISGKGKEFHFQGRDILQSLLEDLLEQRRLTHATDVVLSGTSAGGLALVLQGDFIRPYIPQNAKVRGLIDAALFLDRNTENGLQLARQQFKALYSLHRPILNTRCIESMARKNRYLCLFPEYSIKYLKLPVFIVNSLYDHWQLSYLNGLDCVYDEKKCDTKQHDEILTFRDHMFRTIKDIKQRKNDTGVFANSCFAHGQAILDYTWTKVKIDNKNIAQLFSDWYNNKNADTTNFFQADCKYPCNGSCPRFLAQKCVANFKGASEHRRKREAQIC